jgi:Mn2+/Fe2+ NRAMP family transporter
MSDLGAEPLTRASQNATSPRSSARTTAMVGAAFLMATSAIGPGFLTQTTVFTQQLGASFGFAILISVLFDLGAQLNIWRVVVGSGLRAQTVANTVMPGLGHLLSALVVIGGLAFNVGNVAGCGLGLNVLFGVDVRVGAAISAAIAIWLFVSKDAGRAMDRFAQILGVAMVLLACWVAVAARPPLARAAWQTLWPERLDALAVVTIVGGTVGGYITFAGAHRLIDAGHTGSEQVPTAIRSASLGIAVATVMRVVLFLGALGIVSQGFAIDSANPPASVFRLASGELGYRFFGIVMWAASITSVVGSAYTSVSFIAARRSLIVAFIAISTAIFMTVGRPVTVLVFVGALNGLILPLGLGTMLLAAVRPPFRAVARTPAWLWAAGVVVTIAMAALGIYSMVTQIPPLLRT